MPGNRNRGGLILMVGGVALVAGVLGGVWLVRSGLLASPGVPVNSSAPATAPPAAAPASLPVAAGPAQPEEISVTIPADSLERMQLGYGQVTTAAVSAEVRVPGTVEPNGYRQVKVTSLVGGVATRILAELGQTVKRGAMLAQLYSRDLAEAQTVLIGYEAELEVEHKKLLRTQELVNLGAASREELEAVQGTHQVHTAHVEEARQKLVLFGLTDAQIENVSAGHQVASDIAIPAPMDGVILARNINLGQVVTPEQELFTVTDLSSVWIEGSLLENDFAMVRTGSRATITTPAYPGRTYRGTVDYIDPRVDPQTRTAKVRVIVENRDLALRLGMYMDMLFATPGARVPVVPSQAIQQIGTLSVVYIPVEGEIGRFLQRTVSLAEESPTGRRIIAGLRAGDRVVTSGSFLLRAEALRQHPQ